MSQKSIELRQQRATLVQEMHSLVDGKTEFKAEAETRWSELDKQVTALKTQIDAIERTEGLTADINKTTHVEQTIPGDTRVMVAGQSDAMKRANEMRASEDYKAAFRTFCATGNRPAVLDEVRTYSGLATGSSTAGETLVPIGFQRELETKMIAFGGMRRNARVLNTSTGNPLHWPTQDDTGNVGEFLSEAAPVSQVNPTFGEVLFGSNLASSKQVLVSVQLLQDSAFDVEGQLSSDFAVRLARVTNLKYTKGNGSGVPLGILDATSGVPGYGSGSQVVTAVGANGTNNTGSTDLNSIGLIDDIDGLIAAVDPSYRVGAKFMAHWSTIDALRKQKDGFGRPLWQAGVAEGQPDKIYGYEYDWNADMDTPAANKYSVIFGNFGKYIVRDVGGITVVRYNELYMPNHQIGFQAFMRTDGNLIQSAAFSVLHHPAS